VACDLLLLPIRTCILLFEQLIGQQMVWLQNSILKHLHHHTLSNMFFNKIFETHHVHIFSCYGLGANIWFTTWLVFLTFQLSSLIFCTMFHMWFELPHPSIVGIFHVCAHIPLTLWVSTSYMLFMANKHMGTHDAVRNTFAVIVRDVGFHVGWEQLHALPSIMFNSTCHCRIDIVLNQRWHPHFNQHYHCPPNASRFTSLILCNSRICSPWQNSSQRKELSQLTPHWSIPPFSN
jgi:hypothetical protein